MAYKQAPGRMNMPKTGRGIDAATLMTGAPAKFTDPTKKKKSEAKTPKKNTSGILGGDTIMGDENNDGNMVSRGLRAVQSAIQDPTMPASNNRPIFKDGKLNYDSSRMGSVATGLTKK